MPEQLPFLEIAVDRSLAVVAWNDRAARLFATPREAALGRPIGELLPLRGDAGAWPAALVSTDDVPRQLVVDHRTAGELHLEAWVQANGDGATIYAHDITARAARERRSALDSAMLTALKDNLDVVLLAFDRKATFLVQEGKGLADAGMTDNQLVGLSAFDVYGDGPLLEPFRRALAGEPTHSDPQSAASAHGHLWESWYVPTDEATSGGAAIVSIALNVTEARRREEELRAKLELIEKQRETIRELSTPIIEVWDGVLTLPIVGLVDSVRTAELMDSLLSAISHKRARFAILDLTGVQVVDTSTAGHLIGLIQAIRLLGADGVLTGIHPDIAQTIVAIGVDLTRVRVFATLRDALKHCIAAERGPRGAAARGGR